MHIHIPTRFRGPTTSGNGGYSAGCLAALLPAGEHPAVEITLRAPPPLDRDLEVHPGERWRVMDGDTLVLEGRRVPLELDVPERVDPHEAQARTAFAPNLDQHAFPECFVCGPARSEGDGLRLFAGRRSTDEAVAAPWTVDPSWFEDGAVPTPVLWAALDCPGWFGAGTRDEVAMLGRITARLDGSPTPGERCVALGWSLGRDGRKIFAGTALLGEDGRTLGVARQTWISLGPAA